MKISLYNNLAACYLKLEEYKNARSASEEALQLDPNQTKAL
jgi:Tetratricopeptide repeat.